VIECRDNVSMAAQVIAQKCRLSPSAAAAVRKENQRIRSGFGRLGMPDLTRKGAIACFIESLDGANTNIKRTAGEWIVASHYESPRILSYGLTPCTSTHRVIKM
jgi:hypothetical protein